MIKKFNDYINEELKDSTYQSAAKKLKELGGAHEKRGKNLLDWIDTAKKRKSLQEYGEYSMNYQVVSGTIRRVGLNTRRSTEREFTEMFHKSYRYDKDKGAQNFITISSLREAPNKCSISAMTCNEFEEECAYEDKIPTIYINLFIVDLESGVSHHAFNYEIPITWSEDNTFKIDGIIRIGIGWNEDESKILFSDRLSAVKFKKMMKRDNIIKLMKCENGYNQTEGIKENYYDILRKFFMEYSTAEEMEKIFKLIESVPVNQLWD
jgi:hypothetical protein